LDEFHDVCVTFFEQQQLGFKYTFVLLVYLAPGTMEVQSILFKDFGLILIIFLYCPVAHSQRSLAVYRNFNFCGTITDFPLPLWGLFPSLWVLLDI
jgi:hypothetical protein